MHQNRQDDKLTRERNLAGCARPQKRNCGKEFLTLMERVGEQSLFRGCSAGEIREVLARTNARIRHCAASEIVVHECLPAKELFVVLSGKVFSYVCGLQDDRRHLVGLCTAGSVVGALVAVRPQGNYPLMLVASEPTELLVMDISAVRAMLSCPSLARFVRNLVAIGAETGLRAARKLAVLSCYETGDRILLHMRHHLEETGEKTLQYSASELAEYLGVNRAALYRSVRKLVRAKHLIASRGKLTLP